MIKNRVIPLALAGAVVAGVLTFAATAQAASSPASTATSPASAPTAPTSPAPSPAAAPTFQMPFYVNQTWKASTYTVHLPNPNSIDLTFAVPASGQGKSVVASASGTVTAVGVVTDGQGNNLGEYVHIDHGNGWATRYQHIETSLAAGTAVVRGQHLGAVGQYLNLTPHIQYTQFQNGTAVRVAFNGTLINVHKDAPKDINGNYPTQNITSANAPSSCVFSGGFNTGSVKCGYGAAVRVAIECELLDGSSKVVRGTFVSATLTSSAHCGGPINVIDTWYETT